MKKIIVGFAGEIASGKGTATKYVVEKYHAVSDRFSTMLRDIADRVYLEQSRNNLQKISTMLRQTFGDDFLAKVISNDVQKNQSDIVVVDGIRRLPDIKY